VSYLYERGRLNIRYSGTAFSDDLEIILRVGRTRGWLKFGNVDLPAIVLIVLNPSAFAISRKASRGNVLPTVKENPGRAIESLAAWIGLSHNRIYSTQRANSYRCAKLFKM
jgi:hypothetical protein